MSARFSHWGNLPTLETSIHDSSSARWGSYAGENPQKSGLTGADKTGDFTLADLDSFVTHARHARYEVSLRKRCLQPLPIAKPDGGSMTPSSALGQLS
jgi:hypothetical protein